MQARGGARVKLPPPVLAALGDVKGLAALLPKRRRAVVSATTLHAAAQHGMHDVVAWLIEARGMDPNTRSANGATPLHGAAWAGQLDTVKRLLVLGADPSLPDGEHSATPAEWARRALTLHARASCEPVMNLLNAMTSPNTAKPEHKKLLRGRAEWESNVFIERLPGRRGARPRWEPTGLEDPAMKEADTDAWVTQRGDEIWYRIVTVWMTVRITANGRVVTPGPTRVLERWVGTNDPALSRDLHVVWPPTKDAVWVARRRNEDLTQASEFLDNLNEPGVYRLVSWRRNLRPRRERHRWKIRKIHSRHIAAPPAIG
jgi:hypothetical protein